MRRREYLGNFELMVLLAVMRLGEDAYGVPISREIEEQSGHEVAVAMLSARPLVGRLYAVVLLGFAAFALLIAGVGLFGVLSYSVAQRTREIGVRTALGAHARDIIWLVLRQAAIIAVLGIVAGLWTSFAASRYLNAFLYGVDPHDAVSFGAGSVIVVVVTVAACIVPARRAARVEPLQALRARQ